MPRSDSLALDARWPAIAAELATTPQRSLSLPELARREGIAVWRIRAAMKVEGIVRPPDPAPVMVRVTIELPETSRGAVLEEAARCGWKVLQ